MQKELHDAGEIIVETIKLNKIRPTIACGVFLDLILDLHLNNGYSYGQFEKIFMSYLKQAKDIWDAEGKNI